MRAAFCFRKLLHRKIKRCRFISIVKNWRNDTRFQHIEHWAFFLLLGPGILRLSKLVARSYVCWMKKWECEWGLKCLLMPFACFQLQQFDCYRIVIWQRGFRFYLFLSFSTLPPSEKLHLRRASLQEMFKEPRMTSAALNLHTFATWLGRNY